MVKKIPKYFRLPSGFGELPDTYEEGIHSVMKTGGMVELMVELIFL